MNQPEPDNNLYKAGKLDAFLVDNQELEKLNARLAAFNLFNVLRIERAEIRHSNVLAWLLTPNETHGLGSTFLRRFFSRLLMENECEDMTLTPAKVELMNFDDIEVFREWQNIDVLVRSRRDNWALLIENKIHSKEKKGALVRYKESVRQDMPGAQIVLVLLTIEGEEPSEQATEAGFVSLSHIQVLDLAERIIEQNRTRIPSDAAVFLDHYLSTLRRVTMQDTELVDLCKTIYSKHREAIDLIVEYGATSSVVDAAEKFVVDTLAFQFMVRRGSNVWFLPPELEKVLPSVAMAGWAYLPRPVPICLWYDYWKNKGKLGLVIEVGPMADADTRVKLLKTIEKGSDRFRITRKGAFSPTARFTRILTKYQALKTTEDGLLDDSYEHIADVAKRLWKEFQPDALALADIIKNFNWGDTAES